MEPPFYAAIVIDTIAPNLNISPSNGALINTSLVDIRLDFDEGVMLQSVKISSKEIKNSFTTTDSKTFTTAVNLSDGTKNIEVAASDYAGNQVSKSVSFIVDAYPTVITLISPKFGVASQFKFNIVMETDNDASCRYSLDEEFEFESMEPFSVTNGVSHTLQNFDKIAVGDNTTHKFYVKCKDPKYGITSKNFDISVDTTKPELKSVFAFPNPIIEKPSVAFLNVESDEPVICKYSSSSRDFSSMDKFQGFNESLFRIVNKQNITFINQGNFSYYIACENMAELVSDVAEVNIVVDLTAPIIITSHTPEYFNSTEATIVIGTNKKTQCKFSRTDQSAQSGEIFGASGYSHTRKLNLTPGNYTFYVVCKDLYLHKFSDVSQIKFAIDNTPPSMLWVNDSSTLELFQNKTCFTDKLRVKWLGKDDETRVNEYFYSILKGSQIVVNFT